MIISFDVGKLAKSLRAKAQHRRLADMISRAGAASSIREDLTLVRRLLRELRLLDDKHRGCPEVKQTEAEATMCAAFAGMAIVTYGRAWDENAKGRSSMSALLVPSEFKEAHRRILELRHNVTAHYGIGKVIEPWIRETVVLSVEDNGFRITCPFVRANYRGSDIALLESLINAVDEPVNAEVKKRIELLGNAFAEMSEHELGPLLKGHQFDPHNFFVTKDMVDQGPVPGLSGFVRIENSLKPD